VELGSAPDVRLVGVLCSKLIVEKQGCWFSGGSLPETQITHFVTN
jgi:hypothetical protein